MSLLPSHRNRHPASRLPALERTTRTLLNWAVGEFPEERLALVSAFGPGSSVLIHMLADVAPSLPVIFIDTLHHFPETLQHVERVRAQYSLNLRVYRPARDVEEFERVHGPRLWERDLDRYQRSAKVEPFLEATRQLEGWITGRRRDQSPARATLAAVERPGQVLINPLTVWTRADVWSYIHAHSLPYNPLHDRGFTSIGDQPLTQPVSDGEPERAGRWRDTGRLECGIHLHKEWAR